MIEEGILEKCLRCSSSCGGHKISPLTPQYVSPRLPSFIQRRRQPAVRRAAACDGRWVERSYNVPQTSKTNKSQNGNIRRAAVIPCLIIQVGRLLWSRFFSHSKNHGRPAACVACEVGRGTAPVFCVSMFTASRVRRPWKDGAARLGEPQFNYEPFNSSSVNIRFWSWNYRGCWHQTCPPIVTRCWMALNIPHCNSQKPLRLLGDLFLFAASTFLVIGQFTRLLPSVEVVAISQAPSPESNPNPPLPSTPWQSTTRPTIA